MTGSENLCWQQATRPRMSASLLVALFLSNEEFYLLRSTKLSPPTEYSSIIWNTLADPNIVWKTFDMLWKYLSQKRYPCVNTALGILSTNCSILDGTNITELMALSVSVIHYTDKNTGLLGSGVLMADDSGEVIENCTFTSKMERIEDQ